MRSKRTQYGKCVGAILVETEHNAARLCHRCSLYGPVLSVVIVLVLFKETQMGNGRPLHSSGI